MLGIKDYGVDDWGLGIRDGAGAGEAGAQIKAPGFLGTIATKLTRFCMHLAKCWQGIAPAISLASPYILRAGIALADVRKWLQPHIEINMSSV